MRFPFSANFFFPQNDIEQWQWKLENFEEDGDEKLGLGGLPPQKKSSSVWAHLINTYG